MSDQEVIAEIEWYAPDNSVSAAVVSMIDNDGKEGYGLVLAAGEHARMLARFDSDVTYELIAALAVLWGTSDPRISERMKLMLEQPVNIPSSIVFPDGTLTESK